MHDISRNAREQAQAFATVCERYAATLVAPHFAADRYPNYQRLGRSRHVADRGKRADEALVSILDDVARLTGVPVYGIYLFGSAPAPASRCATRWRIPGRGGCCHRLRGRVYVSPSDKPFPRGIAPGTKRKDLAFRPKEFLRVRMTVLESQPTSRPRPPSASRVLLALRRATRHAAGSRRCTRRLRRIT